MVTVVSPQSVEEEPPLTKKLKITASPQTTRGLLSSTTSSQNLSGSEVLAVRQLILGMCYDSGSLLSSHHLDCRVS